MLPVWRHFRSCAECNRRSEMIDGVVFDWSVNVGYCFIRTTFARSKRTSTSLLSIGLGFEAASMYSPTTWAKQRRSEFKAGQLSHQQSLSVSNMSNAVAIDMDENERKIVNEFCHYLEKSKQLFNGLRCVPVGFPCEIILGTDRSVHLVWCSVAFGGRRLFMTP